MLYGQGHVCFGGCYAYFYVRKKQKVKRLIAVPIINVDCLCHGGCWEREIIVKISNFKGQMLVNPYSSSVDFIDGSSHQPFIIIRMDQCVTGSLNQSKTGLLV